MKYKLLFSKFHQEAWGRMDGWMVGWMDVQMNGWIDGWIYRQSDVQIDGWMDRQIDE